MKIVRTELGGRGIRNRFGALVLVAVAGVVLLSSLILATSGSPCRASTGAAAADRLPAAAAPDPPVSGTTGTALASSFPAMPATLASPAAAPPVTLQVSTGVMNAEAHDVEQSVAVIDRRTGELVASHAGDASFNTESITKLFTVAYYLIQVDGAPGPSLGDDLRSLIQESNNTVQIDLWQSDIVPTIADRYGLTGSSNSAAESPNTWGSDQTTANDAARFLYGAAQDPVVGPHLLTWMTGTPSTGADGFNQLFGFNNVAGNHGSKQGWSDPGWSPANLHSVGFTDPYIAAILQTSPTATYATMRSTSTTTARLIAAAAH